jgi:hypothetical protein
MLPPPSLTLQVKKSNPGLAVKEIAQKLGELWRALSDAQKEVLPPVFLFMFSACLMFFQAYKRKAEALKN